MKVLWTPRAASDLDHMMDFIGKDSPEAAIRVADRVYNQVMQLATMPHIGRGGEVPGTRELVFHPLPYIAVYRVTQDSIRILRSATPRNDGHSCIPRAKRSRPSG